MQTETPTKLHSLLTPIDINLYPKERVKKLWDLIQTQSYAFDDLTRGNAEYFLHQFILPSNQFLEIGDLQGLVSVVGMQPEVNSALHFAVWDPKLKITSLIAAGKSLIDQLFFQFDLSRLTAVMPQTNEQAKRLAILLGFKYEGAMRKCFLSNGIYSDLLIYGLLRSEHETVRSF